MKPQKNDNCPDPVFWQSLWAKTLVPGLFFLFVCAPALWAEPRLPHLFSDHMVLQRDAEIRVWGWAAPQEKIRVRLAGETRETTAAGDASWNVALPALGAGGPFELEVRGNTTVVFKDVLIGEVWVASGQSNMTYALGNAAGAAQELTRAQDAELRLFTVPQRIALEAQTDTLPASWEICSPDTAKSFSAVAYYFARDLRRALGVPVGIILSAWPGTQAEEWTRLAALRGDPMLQPIAARWDAATPAAKEYAAHGKEMALEFDDFELLPAAAGAAPTPFSDFAHGSSAVSTGGSWSYSWQSAPATSFALRAPGRGAHAYAAKISGRLTVADDARWLATLQPGGAPADLTAYAGVRFWVRGDGAFLFRTLQPTIYDWDDYGTEILHATPNWQPVTVWFKNLRQEGWGVREPLTLKQLTGFVVQCLTDLGDPDRPPSGLREAMIAPLQEYRVRGAIWYQGEGNAQRAFQYRALLPAMIGDWRAGWREGDFPFLIVQLPNQGHSEEFADSWWAELREAQLLTAKRVANVGLAVTIDVGEAGNLHPPRKEEIGQRLALWALGTTYGKKIEYAGPLYDRMSVEGHEIRVRFQHVGNGLVSHGDTLNGFTIAGADGKFHRAAARIAGDAVLVASDEVASPVAVRYAWGDSPECNLYNREGLPASPFRTDEWPGATYANR
jgi:sialate O-acetylesterase